MKIWLIHKETNGNARHLYEAFATLKEARNLLRQLVILHSLGQKRGHIRKSYNWENQKKRVVLRDNCSTIRSFEITEMKLTQRDDRKKAKYILGTDKETSHD